MRIFINFADESGYKRTSRLHISNYAFTSQLITAICSEIGAKKRYVIIKLKYDPYNVQSVLIKLKIVEDWPLSHYPIKSGSTFLIEFNEKYKYQELSESTQSLHQVLQENDDPLSEYISERKTSFVSTTQTYSGSKSEKDDLYLEECLERMIEAVKAGDLEKVAQIIKEEPVMEDQNQLEKMMQNKNRYLVTQIGDAGRSAFHEAISSNNLDIFQFLLIKGANLRTLTIDQYTPLQLAVLCHSVKIMKILLEQKIIDINQVTSWGSALHLAVSKEDKECLQLLLCYDADVDICNREGKCPIQICTNQTLKKLLEKKKGIKNILASSILKGQVFEITPYMYRHKERVMILNPFKQEVLLQNKSKEVKHKIPFKAIKEIEIIEEKRWLMNDDYFYFNIKKEDAQEDHLMIALRHEKTYLRWIKGFNNVLEIFQLTEFSKEVPLKDQTVELINDQTNQITLHKRKVKDSAQPPTKDHLIKSSVRQQNYFLSIVNHEQDIPLRTSVNSHDKYSQIIPGSVLDFQSTSNIKSTKSDYSFPEVVEASFAVQTEVEKVSLTNPQSKFRKNSQKISIVSEFSVFEKPEITFKDFELLKLIGNGSFGQVYLAKHIKSEKTFALKVLSKKKLTAKKQLKYAVGEANILKKMNCPFVITLHYAFQTPLHLYMALDNCPNGDLSEVIIVRGKLSQSTACFVIAQLILAVEYLHSKGILYRDMKPENILIAKDGYIKLTDFGLSKQNCFSMSFCGSPAYLSPEMLEKKGVGFESDIYGIGTVLYQMVVGQPPFYDDEMEVMFQNIKNGKLFFPGNLSAEVKSIICRLLARDVSKRLGSKDINEIKKHQFFKKLNWKDLTRKRIQAPKELFIEEENDDASFEPVSLKKQEKIKIEVGDTYEANTVMMNRVKNFTFVRSCQNENEDKTNFKT